jgi:regulator of sirC expression with transglutaminase-like and TPR domain
MMEPESLSANRLLFDLASRLGSLEGYLYCEEKVEKKYLPNWLQNVDRQFASLAFDVQKEIHQDYLQLLQKVHALLQRLYGDRDENTIKISAMISNLKS